MVGNATHPTGRRQRYRPDSRHRYRSPVGCAQGFCTVGVAIVDGFKKKNKLEKKADKAEAKLQKKLAKAGVSHAHTRNTPQAAPAGQERPTPAERSALAAERQVRLQKYRIAIALVGALLMLAGFLATVKPWKYLQMAEPTNAASSDPSARVPK